LEAVRSEITRGKALELLVERASVVDEAGNPVDLTLPTPDASTDEGSPEPTDGAAPSDDDAEESQE
jgi:trigger factor